jgi:hypothetical protein
LIALWLMVKHDWNADCAVSWLRLARSGCIFDHQHAFLRTLENGGLEKLLREEDGVGTTGALISRHYTMCPRGGRDAWRRIKSAKGSKRAGEVSARENSE